jgi:hypothetical protein
MTKHYVPCSCGGGADVVVEAGNTTGVTECACGRMLFWTGPAEPVALSFGVADSSGVSDRFGG